MQADQLNGVTALVPPQPKSSVYPLLTGRQVKQVDDRHVLSRCLPVTETESILPEPTSALFSGPGSSFGNTLYLYTQLSFIHFLVHNTTLAKA